MSKVVKGIKKVFKKIVSSKIFKVVLVAAAIYFGGAALGMWQSGSAAVNGAWTAAGSQASQAAALQATGAAATGSTLQAGAGVMAAGQGGLATVAPTAGTAAAQSLTPTILGGTSTATLGTAGGAGATAMTAGQGVMAAGAPGAAAPAVAAPLAPTVAAPAVKPAGIISKMMNEPVKTTWQGVKNVGTFAKENPILAQGIVSGISAAAGPDEMDVLERKYELEKTQEEEDRARRNTNLNVGSVTPGFNSYDSPMRWASTGQNVFQNGLISRRVGG